MTQHIFNFNTEKSESIIIIEGKKVHQNSRIRIAAPTPSIECVNVQVIIHRFDIFNIHFNTFTAMIKVLSNHDDIVKIIPELVTKIIQPCPHAYPLLPRQRKCHTSKVTVKINIFRGIGLLIIFYLLETGTV